MGSDPIADRLAALRRSLDGRAAGVWRVGRDRLDRIAFDPAPDLPAPVAEGFEAATRSVDLDRLELGIVRAAGTGETVVSRAAGLPADVGSGFWLRAFGAARSVAVPIARDGRVDLVVSIALGEGPDDAAVSGAIRGAGW